MLYAYFPYFQRVEDNRLGQGRQYGLAGVLVCMILALLSHAKSYRQMAKLIETNPNEGVTLQWISPEEKP